MSFKCLTPKSRIGKLYLQRKITEEPLADQGADYFRNSRTETSTPFLFLGPRYKEQKAGKERENLRLHYAINFTQVKILN